MSELELEGNMASSDCQNQKIQLVKFDTPTPASLRQGVIPIGYTKPPQLPLLRNPSIGLKITRSPLVTPQQFLAAPNASCLRNRDDLNLFKRRELEEILNLLLPPREFEQDGQKWIQKVSTSVATKRDVVHLRERLDSVLQKYAACEVGICPVRAGIFKQIFADELQKSAKNENTAMKVEEKALEIEIEKLEVELQDLESELRKKEEELEVQRKQDIQDQKNSNKELKNQIEAKIMQKRFVKKD